MRMAWEYAPLDWTTESPTKPGWYWAMYLDTEPWIVRVAKDKDGILKWWEDGVSRSWDLDTVSYWMGPLPVPEPPKEDKLKDLIHIMTAEDRAVFIEGAKKAAEAIRKMKQEIEDNGLEEK